MDDNKIVQLYWERNEQAIVESSNKYGTYCNSIAHNILFNWANVEECVNDTWLHAWNSMPPHKPYILSTFLGKITRNLSFDCYKRNHRDKRGGNNIDRVLDELEEIVSGYDNPEKQFQEKELRKVTTYKKYYSSLIEKLLVSKDDNTVCSPLNTYIAFSMLAEVSDGNTRKQILDMLGTSDIERLRKNVSKLWEINYIDTPVLKSLLANWLWLDNSVKYNYETLNRLAEQYYASSFSGVPGSAEMNEALRTWTDSNTGGLLSYYTKDMSISPDTVLEILSTIYYKAMWREEFRTDNTTQETFHGTKGDTTVDMMHKTDMMGRMKTGFLRK